MKKIARKQIERLLFLNVDKANNTVSAVLPIELLGGKRMLTTYPVEQIEAALLSKGQGTGVEAFFGEVVDRLYADITEQP